MTPEEEWLAMNKRAVNLTRSRSVGDLPAFTPQFHSRPSCLPSLLRYWLALYNAPVHGDRERVTRPAAERWREWGQSGFGGKNGGRG